MSNIFEIKDLYCSYTLQNNGNKRRIPVLHVKDINIPKDKITFVLGSSGSGKSTFMEAIALMSDTIHSDDRYVSQDVFFLPNGQKFDIINRCFKNGHPGKEVNLDIFRFDNFSFIFQATNLMGNFSAIENVAITDYLHDQDNAEKNAEMRLVNMLQMTDIRSFDKKPNEYSGGQRQRFAFARALGAKANVLFGDEPTGNLDPHNSFVLLRLLRKLIRENIEKSKKKEENENKEDSVKGNKDNGWDKFGIRNAILVSHSLELALSFADIIIVIIPPNPKSEDEKDKNVLSCGRSNHLLLYNNDETPWRTGELLDKDDPEFKKVYKEISFLLNYEFIPLSNLLVDLYGKIMEDEKMEKHEVEYYKKIKESFIENFFYTVIYDMKPLINKEILLSKIDEVDKEMGFDETNPLSCFVKENINLNW
jgi:ABC-type lipoprotein export system ATPase subunit